MESFAALFEAFREAFQLPSYFGANFNALEEVLGDLEWFPADAYLLEIEHADRVLIREKPDDLAAFLNLLERVAAEWARAVDEGEPWDRPPRPFHINLVSDTDGGSLDNAVAASGVRVDHI